ncbi:MAG: hypothetical protein M1299_01305 [Firmicutes bacterium]|nr:hypothetical protein [Bacillota bacterium]MCL5038462.1 hypothetical protein [Bacillota bacterium]
MRKEVPMFITILAALMIVFGKYFFLGDQVKVLNNMDKYFNISGTFALLIGLISLTMVHGMNIRRRKEGWYNSVVLLVVMYGYLLLGLIEGNKGTTFRWIYNNAFLNLDATMFSLLAFYIASAAYRAFRIRSWEATVLLIAAFWVMLGNIPFGEALGPWVVDGKDWIMRIPNTAAMRAIQIGAYVGAFAVAMRIILGIERAHMGGRS